MVWSSTWNRFRWVSSKGSDFNFDYHVSFTEEDRSEGAEYNYVPSQPPEGLEEQGLSASLRTRTVRSSTPTPAMPGPTRTSSPPTSSSTSSPREVTKRASSGPCNACGVTTNTAESGPPAGVPSYVPGHSGRPGVRRGPLPTITWWCPRVSPTTRSAPLVRVRVRWRAARQITGPSVGDLRRTGSVGIDGWLVGFARTDSGCGGVCYAPDRNMAGCGGEAEGRHVAVHSLVLAGPHLERLVPDPDIAGVPNRSVELSPWRQVRQVLVPSEAGEIVETSPVLNQERRPPDPLLIAEAPEFGVRVDHPQHLGHGLCHRPPLADLPRLVEPHPDEEDNKITFDLGREPPGMYTHGHHLRSVRVPGAQNAWFALAVPRRRPTRREGPGTPHQGWRLSGRLPDSRIFASAVRSASW